MSNVFDLSATGAVLRALIIGSVVLTVSSAQAAVTQRVKDACKSDYFAHCSEHAVESASLRVCMRRAHRLLSKTCLKALVDDGEATKQDIDRYKARDRK